MAFTSTDQTNIEAAMVTIAIAGVATVSVGGQSVTATSLDELRRLRDMVKGELVSSGDRAGLGIRIQQWKPYYP